MPDSSGLMTIQVLIQKIGEVENKIPDVGSLVKKTNCKIKISDIVKKCFTTSDNNNLLDAK